MSRTIVGRCVSIRSQRSIHYALGTAAHVDRYCTVGSCGVYLSSLPVSAQAGQARREIVASGFKPIAPVWRLRRRADGAVFAPWNIVSSQRRRVQNAPSRRHCCRCRSITRSTVQPWLMYFLHLAATPVASMGNG